MRLCASSEKITRNFSSQLNRMLKTSPVHITLNLGHLSRTGREISKNEFTATSVILLF